MTVAFTTGEVATGGPKHPRFCLFFATVMIFLCSAAFGSDAVIAGELDRVVPFDIRAEPLDKALLDFGTQAHVQIMFQSDSAMRPVRTRALREKCSGRELLTQLLAGTGLEFVVHGKTVQVVPRGTSPMRTQQSPGAAANTNAGGAADPPAAEPEDLDTRSSDGKRTTNTTLKTVVVTGSHILGISQIASPTSSYSRKYIYDTGSASLPDFVQKLSVNSNDINEFATAAIQGGPANAISNDVGGSAIDLRGLGPQATLVLVNGHRLASGNTLGNFVDISMLPLSSIDHVDIVKDSDSATYGADAVGGVVNIVTLSKFQGLEASAREESVTAGSRHETDISGTGGLSWGQGSAVISYEYADTTPLDATSRSFAVGVPPPYYLLPEQVRDGLYGSISEMLSEATKVNGFVLYGHRATRTANASGDGSEQYLSDSTVDSYVGDIDVTHVFPWSDVMSLSIDYSGNDSRVNTEQRIEGSSATFTPYFSPDGKSTLGSLDANYSGSIGHIGGGPVRYAVGAQLRRETFDQIVLYDTAQKYNVDRTVRSEYVEVFAPVFRRLDVTLAERNEHYSDFGSTNSPKVGIVWTPIETVTAKGSYSKAFIAPALSDLYSLEGGEYLPLADPLKTGPCRLLNPLARAGCTDVLYVFGGNPRLGPERASTWTASLQFHPRWARGLRLGASLYSINYYRKINDAAAVIGPLGLLEDEGLLGPGVIQRNVSPQEIAQLAAATSATNPLSLDLTSVSTIADDRLLNLSSLMTRGIDVTISHTAELGEAEINSGFSGTKILTYREKFSGTAPAIDVLDTPYNPLSLRLRLTEGVEVHDITASASLNYSGAYANNRVTPSVPVASWLTLDTLISYKAPLGSMGSQSLTIAAGADNLTDRPPPFLMNPTGTPLNFDGANASPLGRVVFLELSAEL